MTTTTAGRVSLSAFARTLGVRLFAVQRAIADGRLTKATVGRDRKRRRFIRDPEAARAEWESRTRPRVAAAAPGGLANGATAPAPSSLALATQRERDARAALAELDYQRKARDLVPRREAEALLSRIVVAARTSLLALPTRAKQRLPHLMSTDLAELDKLVREVLEELSNTQPEAKGESA